MNVTSTDRTIIFEEMVDDSAIEIFNLLETQGKAVLFVQPHLHAKFFAADDLCLISSANLTHSALGWRSPSNKELLFELDAEQYGPNQWWDGLLASTMRSAQADLLELCLPPGLEEAEFKVALAAVIRGTDIFQRIEQLSTEGLTDEARHTLLRSLCGVPGKDAPRRWQQVKACLSALYPNEYRVETNQEVLVRERIF